MERIMQGTVMGVERGCGYGDELGLYDLKCTALSWKGREILCYYIFVKRKLNNYDYDIFVHYYDLKCSYVIYLT